MPNATIIGSGTNGLSAVIVLALAGIAVNVSNPSADSVASTDVFPFRCGEVGTEATLSIGTPVSTARDSHRFSR
jgi:hypothetical protein